MALKPGWHVAVPHFRWPKQQMLQAKVEALKQTFWEEFLYMVVSAVCAASPQHSPLLVTFQKMCC